MTILSHYTDSRGLRGILTTGVLRATSFLHVNDTSEYFYGWKSLTVAALRSAFAAVPADRIGPNADPVKLGTEFDAQFRQLIKNMSHEGIPPLFVTSFARGSTSDHDERGILTLWDRYTNHKGYCLQFDRDDVWRMLQLECDVANYEFADLRAVKYGVDENDSDFKELVFQLSQRILIQVAPHEARVHTSIYPDRLWAESAFARRLSVFCATHKDPCWEDEREMRILVGPAAQAESRVFTGLVRKKRIQTEEERSFIELGEYWTPRLSPRRVIVGSKADSNIKEILSEHPSVEIGYANLPVA